MTTIFLCCALIGGAVLVLQFLLLLAGVGGDHDLATNHEVGHDQAAFLKLFSLQALSTFATFFGLIGLWSEGSGWSPLSAGLAAVAGGVAALFLVGKMMTSLAKLQSAGNVDLGNAIGTVGKVYLRVPAAGAGQGRVLINVQQRTVECRAISQGDEIPTGAAVRVAARLADDVLVVEPAHV